MPLKTYKTKDEIPADEQDAYTEHNGEWHPTAVLDLADEKRKKATLLNEKKAEKELREAAERERDEFRQRAEANGDVAGQVNAAVERERVNTRNAEAARDAAKKELARTKLADKMRPVAEAAKVIKDAREDAIASLLDTGRVEQDDKGNIIVKDAAGNVTGETLEDLFGKTLKTEKLYIYEGTGSNGVGSTGSTGSNGGAPATGTELVDKSVTKFNERRAARGNPLFPAQPAAATK